MTVIILTTASTSPWTVPSDWNSAANTIETIGAGGGGAQGGGGGGGYSVISNLTLTPGGSAVFTVGVGGAGSVGSGTATAGGATFFNGATLATSSVGANGGHAGAVKVGGVGGSIVGAIGTAVAGGSGGTLTSSNSGCGGGGAGGPNGTGQAGGTSNSTNFNDGGGGGGSGGGSPGGNATASSAGSGGNNFSGSGGGVAVGGGTGAGAAGTNGGGAAGGHTGGSGGGFGGAGGAGVDMGAGAAGSGGGGGGSGVHGSGISNSPGGVGGLYGGGGGGASVNLTADIGGAGANGVIVITYTPATSTAVTGDFSLRLELLSLQRNDRVAPAEFQLAVLRDWSAGSLPPFYRHVHRQGFSAHIRRLYIGPAKPGTLAVENLSLAVSDKRVAGEMLTGVAGNALAPAEDTAKFTADEGLPTEESARSAAIDAPLQTEATTSLRRGGTVLTELLAAMAAGTPAQAEWAAGLLRDAGVPIESLGSNAEVVDFLQTYFVANLGRFMGRR